MILLATTDPALINSAIVGFCAVGILACIGVLLWMKRPENPEITAILGPDPGPGKATAPAEPSRNREPVIVITSLGDARNEILRLLKFNEAVSGALNDQSDKLVELAEMCIAYRTERDHLAEELRRLREAASQPIPPGFRIATTH